MLAKRTRPAQPFYDFNRAEERALRRLRLDLLLPAALSNAKLPCVKAFNAAVNVAAACVAQLSEKGRHWQALVRAHFGDSDHMRFLMKAGALLLDDPALLKAATAPASTNEYLQHLPTNVLGDLIRAGMLAFNYDDFEETPYAEPAWVRFDERADVCIPVGTVIVGTFESTPHDAHVAYGLRIGEMARVVGYDRDGDKCASRRFGKRLGCHGMTTERGIVGLAHCLDYARRWRFATPAEVNAYFRSLKAAIAGVNTSANAADADDDGAG